MPRVVVLDLLYGEEILAGKGFYETLRRLEREKHTTGAMVLIWSRFMGDPEPEAFVKESLDNDGRLVSLPTKDGYSLRRAVESCIRRLEGESSSWLVKS